MKASDEYLVKILDTLESRRLLDNTLIIATADHGEMGTAHGGLRQKNFNFYEETTRIPLVYSNPRPRGDGHGPRRPAPEELQLLRGNDPDPAGLLKPRLSPRPEKNNSLVSHVDFLPTLAGLLDTPSHARANWEGVDYSDQILRHSARPPQTYTVFTYDDWQSGQASGPYPKPPNHIVSIREQRYKIARYYDVNGKVRPQWEMYDLKTDPLERTNLAYKHYRRTPQQQREYKRLKRASWPAWSARGCSR
jgi:choline-sulfatase